MIAGSTSVLCQTRKSLLSFDHLVGAGQKCRRDDDAEGLRGLQLAASQKPVGNSIGKSLGAAPRRILVTKYGRATWNFPRRNSTTGRLHYLLRVRSE
jgi:hypothetical protein